jgi:hypothetical protein
MTYTQICLDTGKVLAKNVDISDRKEFYVREAGTKNFYALNKYTMAPVYKFIAQVQPIKIKHTDGQYTIYHNGKAWAEMFDSLELAALFVESQGFREFGVA